MLFNLFAILVVFVFSTFLFCLHVERLYKNLDHRFTLGADFQLLASDDHLRKEYGQLVWGGLDPMRVMELSYRLNRDKQGYARNLALCSDYYGQVKYLVKKGWVPTAIAFWLKSRDHAQIASGQTVLGNVEPLDYEVMGAPSYLASRIPILGRIWEGDAILYLDKALLLLSIKKKERGTNEYAVAESLIASKLFTLFPKKSYYREKYLKLVKNSGIKHSDDLNQLGRIARHLGFKTAGELLNWAES
jgi:hypothetical protein